MNSKGTAEWCECSVLPIDGTGTLHSVKQADFYRAQLQTARRLYIINIDYLRVKSKHLAGL